MEEVFINIADKKIIYDDLKQKIFIFNDKDEVFSLIDDRGIHFPYIYTKYDKITFNLLLNENYNIEKLIELIRVYRYFDVFDCINGKLSKACKRVCYEYYAYYLDFNRVQCERILNNLLLYDNKLKPELIKIDELSKLVSRETDSKAIKKLIKIKEDYSC